MAYDNPVMDILFNGITVITMNDDKPVIRNGDSFLNEFNHFVDCVRGTAETISPASDGVTIQKILCGIYESAKAGKVVDL